MNLSHNKDLYDELFIEIARMHDEVDYRKHLNEYRGQRGKRKDYPSVSVGAEFDQKTSVGHHHDYSTKKDFHPMLFRELIVRLGELNRYGANHACRNRVGHCAENYAATGVLNKADLSGRFHNIRVLSDIKFTKAFRPRTWKNIDWCDNCHTMFD